MNSQTFVNSTNGCLKAFQQLLSSPTLGDETMQKQLARFNYWTANIGVFASPRASLDTRLSHKNSTNYRRLLLQLLDALEKHLRAAANGSKTGIDLNANGVSNNDFIPAVSDIISSLHRLSAAIRRSAARDRNSKAANFIEKDDEGKNINFVFQENVTRIIQQRFPDASQEVCQRLGGSISLRRRRILYSRRHQVKLAVKPQAPEPAQRVFPVVTQDIIPQTQSASPYLAPLTEPLPEPAPISISLRPSETDPSIPDSDTQESTIAPSRASSASTGSVIQDQNMKYPAAPRIDPISGEASCPYCAAVLTQEEVFSTKLWRRHLKRDIEPLVCIAESCNGPVRFFDNFKIWLKHIQQEHRLQWNCTMATHRPKVFSDREEFETHMSTEHKGKFNQSQLATLARRSAQTATHAFDECPLCKAQAVEVNSEDYIPKDILVNDRLPRHVAGHLKALALMFLPPSNNSGEEGSDKSLSLSTKSSPRSVDADSIFKLSLTFDDEGSSTEHRDDTEWNFIPRGAYEGHNHDITLKTFVVEQLAIDKERDFNDTVGFAFGRYVLTVDTVKETLSAADRGRVSQPQDWQKVQSGIREIIADDKTLPVAKRLLTQIIPLPRSLQNLVGQFARAVYPNVPDSNIIWGLTDLNISLSCGSPDKLSQVVGWMKRLRSVIEIFTRCLDGFEEDMDELRLTMVDVLDSLLEILGESVKYLRRFPTDAEAQSQWRSLEKRINDNLNLIDAATKHFNDIKSLSLRHGPTQRPGPIQHPEEHENVTFPIVMLPRTKNNNFSGRTDELRNIDAFLGHKEKNFRTYTLYGRHGVGKTDIALEYAYTSPSGFEAIFWVNCETSFALRQSFTNMAVALNIPGADRNGRHEENQFAVLKWLKTTKRRWLMVFDNAERESILRGYWPVASQGSILITSCKFYNFTNDAHRKGNVVKPFTLSESWCFLMKLLGPDWVEQDRKGVIKESERMAAMELLKPLGGLVLAIEQTAELIKDSATRRASIAATYESFKVHQKYLPGRLADEHSETVLALDTIWNMRFTSLSRNSLALLSVLAFLSPDGILIYLFLPRNQKALDKKLAFCKVTTSQKDDPNFQAALSSNAIAPPLLREALDELVDFKLVKQEGRELWVHRLIQESIRYYALDDLQVYFDTVVSLVYEAFPKLVHGDYLFSQWGICETYISHGIHLSFQFANLNETTSKASKLKGNSKFIDLLSNCAWFLYEISDYNLCFRLVETARVACRERAESLQYATLCMIAGSAYYELNQLPECRESWENFMQIQEALLPPGNLALSNSYHNMGNLEATDWTSEDNLEKAADYLNRAITIRVTHGDTAINPLANSYLCMSRVHLLKREYEKAIAILGQSEALFFRIHGADSHFMAHVHYAYGNIDFAQGRWAAAKRAYEASLKIGLAIAPIHPITAAAYYSLGCVEHEQGNFENAKAYLEKAMAIAQLRSPDRDDGTMARIMWKLSVVLETDPSGIFQEESTELRIRAELALKTLNSKGMGTIWPSVDEDGNEYGEVEDAYDSLVPGHFR